MAPAELSIVDVEGARHTLALVGELDLATVPGLEHAVTRACGAGAQHVVLDFGGVEFLDSMGLHAIMRLRRRTGRISVVHASSHVRRVFEVIGIPLDDAPDDGRAATAA